MIFPWHLYVMGAIYIIAGITHFIKPDMYERILPPFIPAHLTMVYISGLAEIILGCTLFIPATKDPGLYGIIAMLFAFLSVHFYMLSSVEAGAGIPYWILILRIPLQFVLIAWAWFYLRY